MIAPFYQPSQRPGNATAISPGPVVVSPAPWPKVLLPMRRLAKASDRGLGDIVERLVGPIGGNAFKKWYLIIFGKPCHCAARRDKWNRKYPLV